MQVKNILSLNNININKNNLFKKQENNEQNVAKYSTNSPSKFAYYLPTNFKSNNTNVYFNDLLKFENVHCPLCGVKMFSKKEYQNIVLEGAKIESAKEFVNWIEKKEEHLSANLKGFLKLAKKINEKNATNTTDVLFNKMQEQSISDTNKAIVDMQQLISNFEKENKLNDTEKVLLDECLIRLGNFESSKDEDLINETRKIFRDTIQNIENENRHRLFYELKSISIPIGLNNRILSHKDENSILRRQKILQALFLPSCSNKKSFWENIDEEKQFLGNKILTCQNCKNTSAVEHFATYKSHPELENTFEQYLTDISKNILENKEYSKYTNYPYELVGLVKSITKRGINLRFNTNQTLVKIKDRNFQERRKQVDFPFVNYNNVPCSTCGISTINHEKKLEYFEQITNAKNIKSLLDFLSANYKILHREVKPIIKIMQKEYEQNPNITEIELMDKLRDFIVTEINNQFRLNIQCCDEILPQLSNSKDIEYLEKYKQGVKAKFYQKITKDGGFDYNSYKDLLSETIYQISDQRIKTIYGTRLKESIRKKTHLRFILFPGEEISEKVGGDLKVLVQDMIKSSVATIDHVVAKNRDGDNSPANCAVMCKQCNSEKTNYTMRHWFKIHHKDINRNMQRYLDFVTKLIKKEKIEGYENYPQEFAKKVQESTLDKIVLKYEEMKK